MVRVRQHFPADHIEKVRNDLRQKLVDFGVREKIKPGDRVAITVGSRGVGGLIDLLAGISDAVKTCQALPFIVPAMGSHGGVTPEGQAEILRRLGVSEESAGAPVRPTMETHALGSADNGAVAHVDRFAAEADWPSLLAVLHLERRGFQAVDGLGKLLRTKVPSSGGARVRQVSSPSSSSWGYVQAFGASSRSPGRCAHRLRS
jgi:hypothetical protein